MELETRRSLVVLAFAMTVLVGLAAVWVGFDRQLKSQLCVSHVYQVPGELTTFPAVVGHTIVDRNGVARIVMLQKLTEPRHPNDPVAFHWVDLIAIDPNGKRLNCIVDGDRVRIDRGVQIFFVTNDSSPTRFTVDEMLLDPRASPQAKWDLLVRPRFGK
jgi:hypothetical protein